MFVITVAEYHKNAKKLVSETNPRIWIQPPKLYETKAAAREFFDAYVESLSQLTTFVKLHEDPTDPDYKVLEYTDAIHMIRLTEDYHG